ncbi:hypothetical protein [uncultured Acetatifactor sp.]|uniref:hypothetical protein n=1 Tax=uncultured Acetatifactor sp. TaxID=1671927 RepID=UPI00260D565E|nr:hypothetical protein [uncultured Acetatifactor sp.]
MDSQKKQKLYEEYITEAIPMAAAVGRRIPYHLEYIRKYGETAPVPTDKGKVASERKEGLMET